LAKAVAEAPVLSRIETLDLSLGNLSDKGGRALAAWKLIAGLKNLDLRHHYLSNAMLKQLRALPVKVDLFKQQKAGGYDDEASYSIAVSE
jgi:hypothetical protein